MFSDTPLHHWPLPVTELLRLSPLRGGYSSHHRCDERLELLDTHRTITLDSRGSHCWVYSFPAATPPSTSFPNDRLRRHMSHRSPVRQVSGSVVGDRPRRDRLFHPSDCSVTGNLRRGDALISRWLSRGNCLMSCLAEMMPLPIVSPSGSRVVGH